MLTRQRPAVRDDEVGGSLDEGPVVRDPAGSAQLERDPGVDAALAEVPVERRLVLAEVEVVEQPPEVAEVVAEPLRGYRGVLPAGQRRLGSA